MHVLILGASGMIGREITTQLAREGCEITGVGRRKPNQTDASHWQTIDFHQMADSANWLPLLKGVDAVVNCVGIIRENEPGEFDLLHRAVPVALFSACEQAGVKRVIQVSAQGSHEKAITPYWRTKGQTEADLKSRQLHATILRPSLVYGREGASSVIFRTMATLPIAAMPLANRSLVQPIHVEDLARVVVRLLVYKVNAPETLATVGPRQMTMAEYLADLRAGMKALPAWIMDLPDGIAQMMAKVGEMIPGNAFTPDALAMLTICQKDPKMDTQSVSKVLGYSPRDPKRFAEPTDKPAAMMAWAAPALTILIALLWIWTGMTSLWFWPQSESLAWLAACGISQPLQPYALLGAGLLDIGIGVALLAKPNKTLWLVQILLVLLYTLLLSICLPQFWLHPFGPLSKNLPILLMMFFLWRNAKP
ncbi:SDR family oxidoreductase [Leeia sp. TBRC 13508]|uniref:SDR family oxidoreductase n=1 Tax=Leeia speluncae TaxID=2884804 RepID=A0ABS8D4L9_9NEIS|nr:SDR family oxidoreductase [Leeia speluncae]MCB6182938.1 SDR family oxidoreductase [Leeia speluncae]